MFQQKFLQRQTDGQKAQEKMLDNANYQRNANQTTMSYHFTPYQSEWPSSKSLQITNAGKGVENRVPFYTVGGNVNWYNHYGEQCGGTLEIHAQNYI